MRTLVFALASEHVPGFKIVSEKKPLSGRKRKWDPYRLEALLQAVREAKRRGGLTDKGALWFIATDKQFAATWGFPSDHKSQSQKQQWIETLQSRLNDAKRLEKNEIEGEREIRSLFEKFRKT
jgi:hypothetical protein